MPRGHTLAPAGTAVEQRVRRRRDRNGRATERRIRVGDRAGLPGGAARARELVVRRRALRRARLGAVGDGAVEKDRGAATDLADLGRGTGRASRGRRCGQRARLRRVAARGCVTVAARRADGSGARAEGALGQRLAGLTSASEEEEREAEGVRSRVHVRDREPVSGSAQGEEEPALSNSPALTG